MIQMDALLVFCEGRHDTAFVELVLKRIFDFSTVKARFADLPAPLRAMFPEIVQQHAAGNLDIDMAHKFFLPDHILEKDARIVLIFNSGGLSKADSIKTFLSSYLLLLEKPELAGDAEKIITNSCYVLLYDADSNNARAVFERSMQEFSVVKNRPFMPNQYTIEQENGMAAFFGQDKGVYVWGNNNGYGTLEDILMSVMSQENALLMQQAGVAVDSVHAWDTQSTAQEIAVAEQAKRLKAVITLAGQKRKPGASMSVIVAQSKLITKDALNATTQVQVFKRFISKFLEYCPV